MRNWLVGLCAVALVAAVAFAGTTNFDDLAVDSITVSGATTITGATTVGGALTVTGTTTLSSTIEGVVKLKPLLSTEVVVITGTTTPEGTMWWDKTNHNLNVFYGGWNVVSMEAK